MIVLKVRAWKDLSGAFFAEFTDGLGSVSQHNALSNVVEVRLDGFNLAEDEVLKIAYSTSLNENDPNTETVGFTLMEKDFDMCVYKSIVPTAVSSRRGAWYLDLKIAQAEEYGYSYTLQEKLLFNVTATAVDDNGRVPSELDFSALYSQAVSSADTAKKSADSVKANLSAFNAALDSKISKFESVGVGYYLYTYYQGETKPLEATNAPLSGSPSVILRDVYGRAQVSMPVGSYDITNKNYVDGMLSHKVSNTGNPVINGSLTINGNLIVTGETTTVKSEKLEVSDNFIVVNANGIENIVSGLIIKTQDSNRSGNAYAILYNPVTDSVDLGLGTLNSSGEFEFDDTDELQSIATRAQNIPDGAILRWDAEKNTLVNSGKTYTNLQNAYEFAQEGGFEGTVNEFRQMLARVSNNALYLDDYDGFVSVTGTPTEGLNYDNINEEYYSCSGLSGTVENRENIIIANEEFGLPVREIAAYAFFGEDIKTVNIPDSVLWINENAFDGCVLLERVILGDGIDTIKEYAFNNCNLKTVNIPNSTTEIWENAFSGNEFLRSVMIGANVKEIGENAFSGCTSLIQIGFGGTVAQWLAVEKGADWNLAVPATYVVCKNGTVKIKED